MSSITRTAMEIRVLLFFCVILGTDVHASTQSVPALQQEDKDSDVNPAYIAVPVVICVIAIIVVILFLLWRRNKSVSTVLKREKGPAASSVTNKTYEVKAIDKHCSLINIRKSCDSGYAEIPLDFLHPVETLGNVYQTIDSLPEDHIGNTKNYSHLKQPTTKFIDINYSHIKTNQPGKQSIIDTSYAHIKTAAESKESKDSFDDGNATYNRLDTTPKATTGKYVTEGPVKGDIEPEYNHARAGCPDPENDADEYSHLNGSKQTPHTFTQKGKYQYDEKKRGTNHPEVEPYEFAKEPENPQYEFARDVDKLNSANNSRYAQSVGNTNNYFILEAEEESASNDASFRVVEGFPQEMADTTEHANLARHQYFVLEKTET